jgi:glycosyltransferase involved in cell wall biosynthesis
MSASLAAVVVPTRDRPQALARCLAALRRQTVWRRIEIIVVDDASNDREAVAETVATCVEAQLVRSSGQGPAAARNVGARATSRPYVLFIDDDCEAQPDWAARLLSALEAGAEVVAGSTWNARPRDALGEASQLIANALVRPVVGGLAERVAFAPSSNLGCRAEVLRRVPFDETFTVPGGEDRDWCARLGEYGIPIQLEPTAVVYHHHDLTLPRFWRQQVRYGRGAYRCRRQYRGAWKLERPSFYLDLLRRAFGRGVMVGALVATAQVAAALGFFSEWARLGRR